LGIAREYFLAYSPATVTPGVVHERKKPLAYTFTLVAGQNILTLAVNYCQPTLAKGYYKVFKFFQSLPGLYRHKMK